MGLKNRPQDESSELAYPAVNIDNCTAHMSVPGLTNKRLTFFPANCISKLRLADQTKSERPLSPDNDTKDATVLGRG